MRREDFPEDFLKKPGKQMRSVWAIGTPKSDEKEFINKCNFDTLWRNPMKSIFLTI